MEDILLYHGSGEIVEFPEIRKTKYTIYFLKRLHSIYIRYHSFGTM